MCLRCVVSSINSSMANNISNLNIRFLKVNKQLCKIKHRFPKSN